MDIRCEHKKFAELIDGVLYIKCSSRFCKEPGVVVIHRWVAATGERLPDQRFRDPLPATTRKKETAA